MKSFSESLMQHAFIGQQIFWDPVKQPSLRKPFAWTPSRIVEAKKRCSTKTASVYKPSFKNHYAVNIKTSRALKTIKFVYKPYKTIETSVHSESNLIRKPREPISRNCLWPLYGSEFWRNAVKLTPFQNLSWTIGFPCQMDLASKKHWPF